MRNSFKAAGLMSAILVSSISAFAQTSATSAAAPASQSTTSTTTLTEQKPADAKKWGVGLVLDATSSIKERNEKGNKAPTTSLNEFGVSYKVTDVDKIKVAGLFSFDNYPDEVQRSQSKEGFTALDPYLSWSRNFKRGLLGSNDVSLTSRYYFPVTSESPLAFKNAGFNNGAIRFDSEILWDLNKLVSVGTYLNPRILMRSGTDVQISMREYLVGYLNFSDDVQAYHMTGILTEAASLEGRKIRERVHSETGVNWTAAKNVAFTLSLQHLRVAEDKKAGAEVSEGLFDRFYSHENTEYGLLTNITF
jgi:hypothetical protein